MHPSLYTGTLRPSPVRAQLSVTKKDGDPTNPLIQLSGGSFISLTQVMAYSLDGKKVYWKKYTFPSLTEPGSGMANFYSILFSKLAT